MIQQGTLDSQRCYIVMEELGVSMMDVQFKSPQLFTRQAIANIGAICVYLSTFKYDV